MGRSPYTCLLPPAGSRGARGGRCGAHSFLGLSSCPGAHRPAAALRAQPGLRETPPTYALRSPGVFTDTGLNQTQCPQGPGPSGG